MLQGAITVTNVCEHCKLFPVEDFLWWVCGQGVWPVSGVHRDSEQGSGDTATHPHVRMFLFQCLQCLWQVRQPHCWYSPEQRSGTHSSVTTRTHVSAGTHPAPVCSVEVAPTVAPSASRPVSIHTAQSVAATQETFCSIWRESQWPRYLMSALTVSRQHCQPETRHCSFSSSANPNSGKDATRRNATRASMDLNGHCASAIRFVKEGTSPRTEHSQHPVYPHHDLCTGKGGTTIRGKSRHDTMAVHIPQIGLSHTTR